MLFYFVILVTWVNAVVWDRVVETGTWNEMLPGGWHRPGRRRREEIQSGRQNVGSTGLSLTQPRKHWITETKNH